MKKTQRRTKQAGKRTTKGPSRGPSRRPLLVLAIIVVGVLILFGLTWLLGKNTSAQAAATVNGVPITNEQLTFQYNLLPSSYKDLFTKDQVLEQIIDEELVVQAATKKGLTATPQAVNEQVQQIMSENQLSTADLQKNLADLNVTFDQFERLIARQLLISEYLNVTLKSTTPDVATLRAIYNATQSKYVIEPQVTVRHVLVSIQRADAAQLAKVAYDTAKAGGDFCKIVLNTSDDKGSRETCGQYTFGKGVMVPEFENAAFAMKDGELRMVQTQFGYHIMLKMNASKASVQPFSAVKDQILADYQSAERATQYRALLDSLRSQATIIYANGTKLLPAQPAMVSETPVAPETPKEPAKPEPAKPAAPAAPAPTTNTTAAAKLPPSTDVKSLLTCIAAKSTLYGTDWSSDTQDARELFSKESVSLSYVGCDKQPSACKTIKAYPTWSIAGQQYLGRMTLDQLKNAADC